MNAREFYNFVLDRSEGGGNIATVKEVDAWIEREARSIAWSMHQARGGERPYGHLAYSVNPSTHEGSDGFWVSCHSQHCSSCGYEPEYEQFVKLSYFSTGAPLAEIKAAAEQERIAHEAEKEARRQAREEKRAQRQKAIDSLTDEQRETLGL